MIRTLVALIVCLSTFAASFADDAELDKLIDELAKVSEPGVGYSAYFSGSVFLPYSDTEQLGTFVIGGTQRSKSDTLRRIVAKGAPAIPALVKHLADDRKIALEPLSGMMWMDFADEYDFNARTRKTSPLGVNRDNRGGGENHPNSHAIAVGDLCFVAIGQIVNREYSATRYQPTGGLIVNSPVYSKWLRDALTADWGDFTAEKHRSLLIEDFENPDHEGRRVGAYWRLAFYYPEAVEQLVLKTLKQPTFDLFSIEELCRGKLYCAKPEDRKQLYDNFIHEKGSHFAVGVMSQLFSDLGTLEVQEEGHFSPPLTEFGSQPRDLLIQLFNKPKSVKSSDRPLVDIMSESEHARFIGSLTHDESKRIGAAVKEIFLKHAKSVDLAQACLKCLANRGYDQFLVEQLDRIDYSRSKPDRLHSRYVEAIATSRAPIVRERLLRVLKETGNETYFMHALSGLNGVDKEMVWQNATRILDALPDDTDAGRDILELIGNRFPDKAEASFKSFLAKGTPQRAETMCVVLWYGHALAPKLLSPLLDDKRKLSGFSTPVRVCDRAAQAISHTTKVIRFDSEWSQERKDAAIVEIKAYCKNRR